MNYTYKNHTFVISAYKESPYLEACIRSLKEQTLQSGICIATSTYNGYIKGLAEKYNIPVFINDHSTGIADDWNFAYRCARTELVTIAHQDDVYDQCYVEEMLRQLNKSKNPLIFFANYNEIRNEKILSRGKMLFVKRVMLIPMHFRIFSGFKFAKRLSICMGNPIACWSVTYVCKNLPKVIFISQMKSNLDWEEWEKLSKVKGEFVYSGKVLTYHRVHRGSETSRTISEGNIRGMEDYEMFLKFWPKSVAKLIMKFYRKAEKCNEVEGNV